MSVTLTLTEPGYCEEQAGNNERENDLFQGGQAMKDARESKLLTFENTTQGLGLKVYEKCTSRGDSGIFIKRILPGGLADARGDEIQNRDQILEVNGQSMQGITYDRAVSILRQASASNHVEMIITRDEDSVKGLPEIQTNYGHSMGELMGSLDESSPRNDAPSKDSVQKSAAHDFPTTLDRGLSNNTNGHISPTSSHSSEVATHLMDLSAAASSSPAHFNRTLPIAGGGATDRDRETPLDTLDSMLSKKLIKDPNLRLHIDQLEAALSKLGLELTPKKQQFLRESLTVDSDGMVRFEEFARLIKTLFRGEMGALKGRMTPLAHPVTGIPQQGASVSFANDGSLEDVIKERDALKAEVATLKEELRTRNSSCKQSEEQLLFIRKQAQSVIEEGRTLRTKLHLSEQAHLRAQQTEKDYEEVVAMLENEVAQLRLQGAKSDTLNMQKRLAVLVCQLKKAESGIKTYEVATEKLVKHIEYSLEVLSSLDKSPRVGDAVKGKNHKKKAISALATEGRDVIKLSRSLMENVALPFGWEEAYTSEGIRYYINHLNQTTTWTHPVSCMEHQTNAKSSTTQESQQHQQQTTDSINSPPPPPPLLPPASGPLQPPPPPTQAQWQSQHQQIGQQQQPQKQTKFSNGEDRSSEKPKDITKHSPRRVAQTESGLI